MSSERLLLDSYLKTLKLPTMRAEYEALARRCSQANAPYEDSLQQLAPIWARLPAPFLALFSTLAHFRQFSPREFPALRNLGQVGPGVFRYVVTDLERLSGRRDSELLVVQGNSHGDASFC